MAIAGSSGCAHQSEPPVTPSSEEPCKEVEPPPRRCESVDLSGDSGPLEGRFVLESLNLTCEWVEPLAPVELTVTPTELTAIGCTSLKFGIDQTSPHRLSVQSIPWGPSLKAQCDDVSRRQLRLLHGILSQVRAATRKGECILLLDAGHLPLLALRPKDGGPCSL